MRGGTQFLQTSVYKVCIGASLRRHYPGQVVRVSGITTISALCSPGESIILFVSTISGVAIFVKRKGKTVRLLLAEDEKELADALEMILKHNHYSVDVVYNGTDALSYLEGTAYDGAILDIMMPGMDGLGVLARIRSQKNKVPVLLLTARSGIDDRVAGLDGGANDYLTKPFDSRELLARIRAMTRGQTEASNMLCYGDLTLDRGTFELTGPAGKIRLGNKEFQMLELLLVNPGQVFGVERFMEKIWGYDSDTDASVVWVNISYLRKKLSSLDSCVQIKAVRNQGYSIECRQ